MVVDSNVEGDCKEGNGKEEQEEPTNGLNGLPLEVTGDIISRLPIKSIIQFRFTCKTWKKLSYDPLIVTMHLSHALGRENKSLIFHCSFSSDNSLYFVNYPDVENGWYKEKVSKFEIPFSCSMPRFKIVGSYNGILCLVRSWFHDSIYLYNPFTRDCELLPKPVAFPGNKDAIIGFGFDPSTNLYKVIRIVYSTRRVGGVKCSEVEICCLGSHKWRRIGIMLYQLDRIATPVLLDGRIHWTGSDGLCPSGRLIVSFDLSDEMFREVPGPGLCRSWIFRDNCTLAILGDCLSVSAPLPPSDGCLDIWIMKEYGNKESWVKQFTIKCGFSNFVGTYVGHSYWNSMSALDGRCLRVLCILESGKILLGYRGENLICYDPESGVYNHVIFPGLPTTFQTILHVASLNWIS